MSYNICAAHAIDAILARSSIPLDEIVAKLTHESKLMLKENSLNDSQAGVITTHTFNVEAIIRVMRLLRYKTAYINLLVEPHLYEKMIISNKKHWIAIVKKDKFIVYDNYKKKILKGSEKTVKIWLFYRNFNFGIKIFH